MDVGAGDSGGFICHWDSIHAYVLPVGLVVVTSSWHFDGKIIIRPSFSYFHVRRLGFDDVGNGGRPEVDPANSKNTGSSKYPNGALGAAAVPGGVFNCRFTNPVK